MMISNLYATGVHSHELLEFIETPTFTRHVQQLLSDEEYLELQRALIIDPQQGDLIQGSGGLRKIRFALKGRGKSAGVRCIHYWYNDAGQMLMLLIYPKSMKDDLSARELSILRKLVEELKQHG
ncbi:Toxin HigB-2 [bioreactor metagenome]|uniref:Toxin HigB-2 n=1 Tax=bioreactor metagenome TaxID=1076179 RepID=A0A645BLK9_9ZZZZ